MNKIILSLIILYLLTGCVFAQDSDPSSSDSGVLVSPPAHDQAGSQDNIGNSGGDDSSNVPAVRHKHQHSNSDNSNQNSTGNNSDNGGGPSGPTDEIVVKSTDAFM